VKKKALLVKMEPSMHRELKLCAVEQSRNMTDIVLNLIESYLKRNSKNTSDK